LIENESSDSIERLDALGQSLTRRRAEAIAHREGSGIEQEWREDEEFYEGIDDANRSTVRTSWDSRPVGMATPARDSSTRSTVFLNITRPYTDAFCARVADMLLPTDEKNYSIDATPIPDSLSDMAKGELHPKHQELLQTSFPDPQAYQQAVMAAQQQAQQFIEEAKKKAKKAETRIEDWLIECQYNKELRNVIEDAGKMGAGVLKGPVPVKRRQQAYVVREGVGEIVLKEETKPASKRISLWDLYPDPACGENIHDGSYILERDHLTSKGLKALKGLPGYIDEQIDKCIEEGPKKASNNVEDAHGKVKETKNQYEIWYYYGVLEKEDIEAAGCDCEQGASLDACVTMVNDRVIKVTLNHLDTGEFPYDVFRCQRRVGSWAGIGVSRQIRVPQRMVNAAARNMMDNAGLAAGGIIVLDRGGLVPADKSYAITPLKLFYRNPGASQEDVRKMLTYIDIPIRQNELMNIIHFGLKMAEDITGLPMILQGQQGKAPDTLGGMQMLNNNATGVLRRLAKLFDDSVTEPHIRRYYSFLLQYGEEEDEKGDFQIYARGSSALVERDAQEQFILQMANIVFNPMSGINPEKWVKELLKSKRLEPSNFEYTVEEKQQMQEQQKQAQQQGQQQDPRVAIAQMRAQLDERLAQMDHQFKQMGMQYEAQESDKDRQTELVIAQLEQQVEMAKATGQKSVDFEQIKAMLAKTVMDVKSKKADTDAKLKTQRELSTAAMSLDLHKSAKQVAAPPTEPAGKAPKGRAFQA